MQLDHTDPIEAEVHFIPSATNLCTDLANWPALGPHTCDGVLGVATRNGYTHIQLLTCRTNTNGPPPPS
jgi:hypothetical protein